MKTFTLFFAILLSSFFVSAQNADSTTVSASIGEISIFPNPTTDYVFLSEPVNYVVMNVVMKPVLSGKNENRIDFTVQPKGWYFIEIQDDFGNKVATKKIIKK